MVDCIAHKQSKGGWIEIFFFFFLFNSCFHDPGAIFFFKFMYPVIMVAMLKSLALELLEGEKLDISVRLVCLVGMVKTTKECRMQALRNKLCSSNMATESKICSEK